MRRPHDGIRLSSAVASVLLAIASAACSSGSDGPAAPQCVVSAVGVTPASPSVLVGATVALAASISQQNCDNPSVAWSSSNTAVASVASNGVVTGVTPGTATITATSEGTTGTDVVTVLAPVAQVTLDTDAEAIIRGSTYQLTAEVRDGSGALLTGRTVLFTSSDATVASVDATGGLVTGLAVGTATITATCEGHTATASFTVIPASASVTISSPVAGAIGLADVTTYTAEVRDAADQVLVRPVTWSVDDPTVATITQTGELTPLRTGVVEVRATTVDHVTGTLTQQVIVATTGKRIAWALIPPDASGQVLTGSALNATGGAIRATRTGTGDNTITFERMGRLDASYVDVAMVSMLEAGGGATHCHVNSSQNAANGLDLEVSTSCYATDNTKADQYIFVLVVGGGSLQGRHSFMTSTDATASHTSRRRRCRTAAPTPRTSSPTTAPAATRRQ